MTIMNIKAIPPLRGIREAKGFTIEYVSTATGIAQPTISQIERGGRGVSIDVAEKLVEFYGRDTITEMELLYPERFVDQQAA